MDFAAIQNIVGGLKGVVEGFFTPVVIKTLTGQDYDPATQKHIRTYSELATSGFISGYKPREIDEQKVKTADQKIIFTHPIPTVTNDSIIVINGEEWLVVLPTPDPAKASLTVQIRK